MAARLRPELELIEVLGIAPATGGLPLMPVLLGRLI